MMSQEQPLVSIVTPVFNGMPFIERCIESVLAQDYPRVEHIIQDGGSTDGTVDVIKRYDAQIDWVSEPDEGAVDGLYRALKRCKGDIILALNADDILLPYAASWAVEQMARYPEAAVVYGDEYIIDENDDVIQEFVAPDYDYVKLLCVEVVIPAQAAFIRRLCLEKAGLYADSSLTECGDYEMWVRIGKHYDMVHVPGFVSKFRWHMNKSRQPERVDIQVHDKRMAMDRFFADPTISSDLLALRQRAYGGVHVWAAEWLNSMGETEIASGHLLEAVSHEPEPARFSAVHRQLAQINAHLPKLLRLKHPGFARKRGPDNPLVSIVTPTFNSVSFIEHCIESVLAQDYPFVEHIVQDGASTDGTVDVLKRYDQQIDWVSEPDQGQSDGLDRALKRSRGDIILVLNADDVLLPHAASWAVENMAKHSEAAVIYGDMYIINIYDEIIGAQFGPDPYSFEAVLCVEQVPPAQAAFMRRSHLEQVGLGADVSRSTCPDYEMWVRIGRKFPMLHVPGFLAKYRWHQGSEGCQPDIVERMVQSKSEVMDRVFDDPATPPEIRRLRRRAHASLNVWGASMCLSSGDTRRWIQYLVRGLTLQPSWRNLLQAGAQLRHWILTRSLPAWWEDE